MKESVKQFFKGVLFSVYEPYVIRKEKMKATRMWHEGVKLCEKMCKDLNGPRVYLFYDSKHMVWSPMTYEPNKQYRPSLRQLRWMGKMSGAAKVRNAEDMKHFSYYYTPSKWGALGCKEDNRVRQDKLKLWISYYMTSLSVPMRKCQDYRRQRERRTRRAS